MEARARGTSSPGPRPAAASTDGTQRTTPRGRSGGAWMLGANLSPKFPHGEGLTPSPQKVAVSEKRVTKSKGGP